MEMKKEISKVGNAIVNTTKKHSSGILTGISLIGIVGTVFMTVKATNKYNKLKEENPDWNTKQILKEEIPEIVGVGLCTAASMVGVVGSNAILTNKLQTAIMAAQIADNHNKELKDATRKIVSKQKYEEIMNAKKDIHEVDRQAGDGIYNINGACPIGSMGDIGCAVRSDSAPGDTQMYDDFSGRYFYSSVNEIRSICTRLTSKLLLDGSVTLNEFYDEVGLPEISCGEDYGWNANTNSVTMIDPEFSTTIHRDQPCVIVAFMRGPFYGIQDF